MDGPQITGDVPCVSSLLFGRCPRCDLSTYCCGNPCSLFCFCGDKSNWEYPPGPPHGQREEISLNLALLGPRDQSPR